GCAGDLLWGGSATVLGGRGPRASSNLSNRCGRRVGLVRLRRTPAHPPDNPMPDPPIPRVTLGDLAKQAVPAAPAAGVPLVPQPAGSTRRPGRVDALADLLLAGGNAGPAVALEWLARVRPPLPEALIARFVPFLSDRTIPAPVRVVAAARLLRDLPD